MKLTKTTTIFNSINKLVLGQVALVVGGDISGSSITSVEVYSPEGRCQYNLPVLPLPLSGLTLGLSNNYVLACSGYNIATKVVNTICWKYLFVSNLWHVSGLTLSTTQPKYPAQSYQNWLYFVNNVGPGEKIQFLMANRLTPWTASLPVSIGEGACSVMWGDNMIIFGGVTSSTVVQMVNMLTNSWIALAPMTTPHYSFGCVLLPDRNRVLVISTVPGGDERRSDIYDAGSNTWNVTGSTVNARAGASLVTLGNKVFAIGGNSAPSPTSLSATVEEYDINSGTWSLVATNLNRARQNFAVLSLPATSAHCCINEDQKDNFIF
jgi:hypothetical protein